MTDAEFTRGVPDKPDGLSTDESRYWDTLVDQIDLRILKTTDPRLLRELCSVLAAQERISRLKQEKPLDVPLMEAFLGLCDMLFAFSPVFGMTPKHRAEMDLGPDEFDDFAHWMDS